MIVSKSWCELLTAYRSAALVNARTIFQTTSLCQTGQTEVKGFTDDDDEFRVFDLKKTTPKREDRKKKTAVKFLPPRYSRMPVDQEWSNVWPGPRSFHPATVPLPLFQGTDMKGKPPIGKFANPELMKVPNFLHLTPPAVKKQCAAIKRFCTPWPEGLEDDEKIKKHFPIEVITSDYCHSSPVIRDVRARIVTIKFNVNDLKLNKHAKDKFKRLCADTYDQETDDVVFVADRCPVRKQNYDYTMYLLTALYHESWEFADWEKDKAEADMEYYDWNLNQSKKTLIFLKCWPEKPDESKVSFDEPEIVAYKKAVTDLFNEGENEETLLKYKDAVKGILGTS